MPSSATLSNLLPHTLQSCRLSFSMRNRFLGASFVVYGFENIAHCPGHQIKCFRSFLAHIVVCVCFEEQAPPLRQHFYVRMQS